MELLHGWRQVPHPPPHDCMEWVEARVEIRREADGVVRNYVSDCELLDEEGRLFTGNWRDGNYSCDCNRYLYFCWAADEEEADDADIQCSDGQYRVNLYNPVDGVCHYREFEA